MSFATRCQLSQAVNTNLLSICLVWYILQLLTMFTVDRAYTKRMSDSIAQVGPTVSSTSSGRFHALGISVSPAPRVSIVGFLNFVSEQTSLS